MTTASALTDRPTRSQWIVGGTLVGLIATAISFELLCPGFRGWGEAHPLTISIASGATLVGVTALVVERIISSFESRRWRVPALLAVDAYVYSADRAVRRIYDEIKEDLTQLPSPPGGTWVFRLNEALLLLLDQKRLRLLDVSDFIRRETDELALIAMQVGGLVSHDGRLSDTINRIFRQQARLAKLAELPTRMSFYGAGFSGEHALKLREMAEEAASQADELMQDFLNELSTLRLQVGEQGDLV